MEMRAGQGSERRGQQRATGTKTPRPQQASGRPRSAGRQSCGPDRPSAAAAFPVLRLLPQGAAACLLQLVVTVTLPSVWYSFFYSTDARLAPIPILSWSITAISASLGFCAFVFLKSILCGLHAVMAIALAAAIGIFHTEFYLLMIDR